MLQLPLTGVVQAKRHGNVLVVPSTRGKLVAIAHDRPHPTARRRGLGSAVGKDSETAGLRTGRLVDSLEPIAL